MHIIYGDLASTAVLAVPSSNSQIMICFYVYLPNAFAEMVSVSVDCTIRIYELSWKRLGGLGVYTGSARIFPYYYAIIESFNKFWFDEYFLCWRKSILGWRFRFKANAFIAKWYAIRTISRVDLKLSCLGICVALWLYACNVDVYDEWWVGGWIVLAYVGISCARSR